MVPIGGSSFFFLSSFGGLFINSNVNRRKFLRINYNVAMSFLYPLVLIIYVICLLNIPYIVSLVNSLSIVGGFCKNYE
jgi:hypothetical protein